ncbi:MAG: zf-TFIIB domain-containing protein [Desulfobacterales bacterium]|jgi:protoporphyrinogen oxidase
MAERRVSVIIQPQKGSEEEFFAKRDQKMLKKLRKKVTKEAKKKYCKEHSYHCFRCGTKSLVEVERGNVKIDICVNNNCGAIHLDPGELERIIKDQRAISIVRSSVLAVFKK